MSAAVLGIGFYPIFIVAFEPVGMAVSLWGGIIESGIFNGEIALIRLQKQGRFQLIQRAWAAIDFEFGDAHGGLIIPRYEFPRVDNRQALRPAIQEQAVAGAAKSAKWMGANVESVRFGQPVVAHQCQIQHRFSIPDSTQCILLQIGADAVFWRLSHQFANMLETGGFPVPTLQSIQTQVGADP